MDKGWGSSAGILALIALLLHTLGFPDADRSMGAPLKKDAAKASVTASGVRLWEKQGPWRATQQYLHTEIVSAEGRACQDYLLGLPKPTCSQKALLSLFGFQPSFDVANLRFLIATIADPLHTRMAIESDRDLDAIQRAAFRSGWELATEWLPWTVKSSRAAIQSTSSQEAFDIEMFPGMLVFRRHFEPGSRVEQLLLVMIVAETPTAGVNGFQFEVARRSISLLSPPTSEDVFVAGPRFSGSFLSMTRLLEQWPAHHRFVLQAGSISNSDYARAMLSNFSSRQEAQKAKHASTSSIVFHGSTLPSVAFEHHFAYLVSKLNLRSDQAAKLIEDETGFGVPTQPESKAVSGIAPASDPRVVPDPIPIYRYPRDVAQVRNNYNDAAFAPLSMKTDSTPAPAFAFSLKDTQEGEDIFPMFSTSHTPASQNAELQQTIHYLKRKGVRIASLSATNVFDTIFLANVLSRACPDLRIVLRGPDLLFVQEASQGSLSGLMAISPFPMFPEGAAWSHADTHDTTAFASADQVGEFDAVATLLQQQATLLGGMGDQQKPYKTILEPYEQSFDSNPESVMSAWLLELGTTGWVPIDLLSQVNPSLDGSKASSSSPSWFLTGNLPLRRARLLDSPVGFGWGWIGLCVGTALFTIGFCARLIYLYLRPQMLVWSNLCIVDLRGWRSNKPIMPVVHHRYTCMVSCFSTLSFLNGLLLAPMMTMRNHFRVSDDFRVAYVVGAAFLLTVLTALCISFFLPVRIRAEKSTSEDDGTVRIAWESVAIRLVVLFVPLIATYLWWTCCGQGTAGYLLCFRTLSLSVPLAPLWPLFISGCGLFALCYFHLRRFTWAYRRQPHLDTSTFDHLLCNEFRPA